MNTYTRPPVKIQVCKIWGDWRVFWSQPSGFPTSRAFRTWAEAFTYALWVVAIRSAATTETMCDHGVSELQAVPTPSTGVGRALNQRFCPSGELEESGPFGEDPGPDEVPILWESRPRG